MPESQRPRNKKGSRTPSRGRREGGTGSSFRGEGARPRRRRRRIKLSRILFILSATIVAILVIGSFALSSIPAGVGGGGGGAGVKVNDHWHATLVMEICGEGLNLPPSSGGVHSHGDGLIHIHPENVSEAGSNANLGRFFDSFPITVEEDRIVTLDGASYVNGNECPSGQTGTMMVSANGEDITANFRKYSPEDNDVIKVTFD